ncbi:MAG: PaaI family thioesterase [Coriobacteriales bacterium]|jgi:acyl-CoA thioesterase|nr:PaaI family thioesterase [Coriobacteriales bacterium]
MTSTNLDGETGLINSGDAADITSTSTSADLTTDAGLTGLINSGYTTDSSSTHFLPRHANMQQVHAAFMQDRFATSIGCRIDDACYGRAVCSLQLEPRHQNGMGKIMGGAIFTLADYALAVCSNLGENPTISISNTIDYLASPKGTSLIATCSVVKSGQSVGFYTVDIVDNLGTNVAKMNAKCFRR